MTGASNLDTENDTGVIKESVWTFLHKLLKDLGPIDQEDPRIWQNLDASATRVIGGKENIREFILSDPQERFKAFRSHLCLITDLARAISLHNEAGGPTRKEEHSIEPGERVKGKARRPYTAHRR